MLDSYKRPLAEFSRKLSLIQKMQVSWA